MWKPLAEKPRISFLGRTPSQVIPVRFKSVSDSLTANFVLYLKIRKLQTNGMTGRPKHTNPSMHSSGRATTFFSPVKMPYTHSSIIIRINSVHLLQKSRSIRSQKSSPGTSGRWMVSKAFYQTLATTKSKKSHPFLATVKRPSLLAPAAKPETSAVTTESMRRSRIGQPERQSDISTS